MGHRTPTRLVNRAAVRRYALEYRRRTRPHGPPLMIADSVYVALQGLLLEEIQKKVKATEPWACIVR